MRVGGRGFWGFEFGNRRLCDVQAACTSHKTNSQSRVPGAEVCRSGELIRKLAKTCRDKQTWAESEKCPGLTETCPTGGSSFTSGLITHRLSWPRQSSRKEEEAKKKYEQETHAVRFHAPCMPMARYEPAGIGHLGFTRVEGSGLRGIC